MVRIIVLFVTTIFLGGFLVGCTSTDSNSVGAASDLITVEYKGNSLTCVTWSGSHDEQGKTCDFEDYYNTHPDAFNSSTGKEESVITVDYEGSPLNCVTWSGSHGEQGRACDFVAYHNKYSD